MTEEEALRALEEAEDKAFELETEACLIRTKAKFVLRTVRMKKSLSMWWHYIGRHKFKRYHQPTTGDTTE